MPSEGGIWMYTEENMDYVDNYNEENNQEYNDDNGVSYGTILIRILIIFVCLLLVIWLISKLVGGKKIVNDGTVLNNNIDTIRLASEKYFFLNNNLPELNGESITITLTELKGQNLISEIKDYKGNTCGKEANTSYATLKKTDVAYELKIKLTCDEEQKEVTYYYDLETGECLSCNGNTYMDGSLVLGGNNNTDDEEKDPADDLDINCNSWSKWTTTKLNDDKLLVRTRTLLKGYKLTEGTVKVVYGNWSSYTETPITPSENIEVEVKEETKSVWSGNKTTTKKISDSDTIKVISKNAKNDTYTKTVREKISLSEYARLKNDGAEVTVHDTYHENGTLVYDISYKKEVSGKVTVYTYQELKTEKVNMYRYRTVTQEVVKGETVYTDWVEKLPEGYSKSDELIQYSYKDTSCKG